MSKETIKTDGEKLEKLREAILKRNAAKQLMSLIFELAGYAILLFVDWRIALAMFLLQWAFQIKVVK